MARLKGVSQIVSSEKNSILILLGQLSFVLTGVGRDWGWRSCVRQFRSFTSGPFHKTSYLKDTQLSQIIWASACKFQAEADKHYRGMRVSIVIFKWHSEQNYGRNIYYANLIRQLLVLHAVRVLWSSAVSTAWQCSRLLLNGWATWAPDVIFSH